MESGLDRAKRLLEEFDRIKRRAADPWGEAVESAGGGALAKAMESAGGGAFAKAMESAVGGALWKEAAQLEAIRRELERYQRKELDVLRTPEQMEVRALAARRMLWEMSFFERHLWKKDAKADLARLRELEERVAAIDSRLRQDQGVPEPRDLEKVKEGPVPVQRADLDEAVKIIKDEIHKSADPIEERLIDLKWLTKARWLDRIYGFLSGCASSALIWYLTK